MEKDIRPVLERSVSPYLIKIYHPFIKRLVVAFDANDDKSQEIFIINKILQLRSMRDELFKIIAQNEAEYLNTSNKTTQQEIILHLSKYLGSTKSELEEDKLAYEKRWFDFAAIKERAERRIQKFEQYICFLLTQYRYATNNSSNFIVEFLHNFHYQNSRINCAALDSLSYLLKHKIIKLDEEFLSNISLILEQEQNIWVVAKSLEILAIAEQSQFIYFFEKIYKGNKVFKKHDLVFLKSSIIKYIKYLPTTTATKLISSALYDESPYVRQTICKYIRNTDNIGLDRRLDILEKLTITDPDRAVRGYALASIADEIIQEQSINRFLSIADRIIANSLVEEEIVILQILLSSFRNIVISFQTKAIDIDKKQQITLFGLLSKIIESDALLLVRKQACDIYLEVSVSLNKKLLDCKSKLEEIIKNIPLNETITILDNEINNLMLPEMGKLLYLVANNDFDIEFWQYQGCYVVQRGIRQRVKLWRFLHEIFGPATGKRQGYSHLLAKDYQGAHLVISKIAELSASGVPGEPLYIKNEGVRRFLPTLDYCLAVIKNNETRYIFSAEGTTVITPPRNLINKIYAYLKLSFNFRIIDALKNLPPNRRYPKISSYVDKLKESGIDISFVEDKDVKGCSETKKFFASLSIMPITDCFNIIDYFSSPHENNILSLIIFLFIFITVFGLKRLSDYKTYRSMRESIPLVIGGWGTRGKTGTERLKSALFSCLGLTVASKTTGSNASLVISDASNGLHELPLVRPYDLHTILEQKAVTKFVSCYNAEVFLWECMALNPEYSYIMQLNWMRDNISTITNTYPDHEEMQGPSGHDVAKSIAQFIPQNSSLLTAEEVMLPILQEEAKNKNTTIENIRPYEAELIPQEILEMFPYHEHPHNIALVSLLAKKLNIDEEVALKSMIDNLLPDVGALKYFPPYKNKGKEIHFINGMSANEVVGTINNWYSLGLHRLSLLKNPDIYVCGLINNRHDRPKRSQDFATIMVNVFAVDKYFLIGNNLDSFKKIIIKRWQEYLQDMVNVIKSSDDLETLEYLATKLRICKNEREKEKILAVVKVDKENMQEGLAFKQDIENNYAKYGQIKFKLKDGSISKQEILTFFNEIFAKKIVIIEHEAPELIMSEILKHTPLGLTNKIIGMQNIKSPGIEFIKLWQDYEKCYIACEKLKKDQDIELQLTILSSFPVFNILSRSYVENTISNVKYAKIFEPHRLLIEQIENNLANQSEELNSKLNYNILKYWLSLILELINNFQNTKISRQIYKDLINNRISLETASKELSERVIRE